MTAIITGHMADNSLLGQRLATEEKGRKKLETQKDDMEAENAKLKVSFD